MGTFTFPPQSISSSAVDYPWTAAQRSTARLVPICNTQKATAQLIRLKRQCREYNNDEISNNNSKGKYDYTFVCEEVMRIIFVFFLIQKKTQNFILNGHNIYE